MEEIMIINEKIKSCLPLKNLDNIYVVADFDGTIAHCAIYDFANNKVIQQMNFGSQNLKKVGHIDKCVEEKLSKEIDP